MKRFLCLVLGVAMLLSICACGPQETGMVKDDETQEYVIEWLIPGNFGDDLELVNEEVNKYVKEKINATVNLVPFDWGVYNSKLSNKLSAGEKVDLAWCNRSPYLQYIKDESAIDITEMIGEYAPKTKEALGQFLDGCYINGKLYAVPANKDKAHYYSLVYRTDMAEKYGFDMSSIKTFEDLYPYFETIKQNEPGIWAIALGDSGSPINLADAEGYNVAVGNTAMFLDSNPGKLVSFKFTDEFKRAAEQSRYCYLNGYTYPDNSISDKSTEFKNNGMCFSWINQMNSGKLEELQKNYDYEIAEVRLTRTITDARDSFGSMMFIPYTSKNPERVMKFVELFNTDPYLNNLVNFGIEGVHYEKIDDNTIRSTEKLKDYNFIGNQWVLGNTFINYSLEGYAPDRQEKLEEFNANSYYSEYYGFVGNTEPIKQQLTACDEVDGKYWKIFGYGTADVEETLAMYKEEMTKAGIEEVLAEVQRQYDEWKANK